MNYNDSWNYIVTKHIEHYGCSETTVQRDWEAISSEILGYKRVNNEVKSQFSVQIGSGERVILDILVCKDNKNLFIAELKQYKFSFAQSMEKQIISYFNQLHVSIGLLVCDKLYLYSYNYAENIINKVEIPFAKNNINGIKFVELFSKENYNESKIKEFIKEQSDFILCPKCHKNYIRKINELCDECKSVRKKSPVLPHSGVVHKGQIFNVGKNYELLNILLNRNMTGWMKCWYRLADNYTIDMQVLNEIRSGWTNRIEEPDMFYMDFVGSPDEKLDGHNDEGGLYIALFIKSGKGNQKHFTFYGIYKRQSTSFNHRVYKRISDDFAAGHIPY